jgi:hypothetical protein
MARTGLPAGPGSGRRVAAVAAQGAEVGQHALLGPAADRLGGHLEELGDLGGAQVAGLGWLGHRALPFLGRPRWGSGAVEGSTQAGILGWVPMQLGFPAGAYVWTLTVWPQSVARHLPQWLPRKHLACPAVVVLLRPDARL